MARPFALALALLLVLAAVPAALAAPRTQSGGVGAAAVKTFRNPETIRINDEGNPRPTRRRSWSPASPAASPT